METRFTIALWAQTNAPAADYPTIVSNKDWYSGEIRDYTERSNYGFSRTSGQLPGWAIALQPNGAWAWNLGDGTHRLDYQPTASQRIDDGAWHLIAFSVDANTHQAHLYFDGRQVALYSLTGLEPTYGAPVRPSDSPDLHIEGFQQWDTVHSPEEIARRYQQRDGRQAASYPTHAPGEPLRVLAWNIWNGGREDGIDEGVERVVECIRDSGADIVAMQETYGSGPRIADALGYHLYLRSSNLSIISRYPAIGHHDLFRPFNLGGATLALGAERTLKLFSLWLHYLPDFCNDVQRDEATPESLIEAEHETRASEMQTILEALQPHLDDAEPLIVAGDFNSPSHLDWTQSASSLHCNMAVEWPVSAYMAKAGFTDAYRQVHPDPIAEPGHTWTPRNPNSWQDRIDYVYYRAAHLHALEAQVLNQHRVQWPSDHAAVLSTFTLR